MTLTITSREFSFERADAFLLASDWEKASIRDGQVPPDALPVADNRIEGVHIERRGEFLLLLSGLLITRRSDKRQFAVPMFLAPQQVIIRDRDIAEGTATVALEVSGVYQITLFDSAKHEPLAGRRLRFTANAVTFAVNTDDAGRVMFLGKPTMFRIDTEGESGMTIVPL